MNSYIHVCRYFENQLQLIVHVQTCTSIKGLQSLQVLSAEEEVAVQVHVQYYRYMEITVFDLCAWQPLPFLITGTFYILPVIQICPGLQV